MSFWASRHLMKHPADCVGCSVSFINKTSYRSRFNRFNMLILTSQGMGNTWDCRGPGLLFALCASLRIPGRSAHSAPKGGVQTFARLFLPMAAEGWTPPICPLSPVQRWDWRPWGGGFGRCGGGEESISGCVCPRLDLRKGGLYVTTERGGSTCWAEAQRCSTAQQSREERSCAGETADHPSTGGTHTNKPLWLLEKYRPIPPSPSFLFLSRGLLAFNIVQSRSLWQV